MMVISENQMERLENESYSSFLERMEESILENFPTELDNQELKGDVKYYVEEADKFGFEMEEMVEQYLYLKWKYPSFKKMPLNKEILEILTYPDREAEVKIDELIFFFKNNNSSL